MRTKIIAGNWKMNLDFAQAMALVDAVVQGTDESIKSEIILAPPYPYLPEIILRTNLRTNIFIAAQNCSDKVSGAYTGEVSASMLRSIGIDAIIIGHSERRSYYFETNSLIAEKLKRCLENNMEPIFCCGETLSQRKSKTHFDTVKQQLDESLFQVGNARIGDCIIAYEPVWAIGTGENATAEEAQEMHQFIRQLVKEKYSAEAADEIRILYGGSVNAKNADSLFASKDVDGALIGGSSLKAEEFISIIKSMEKISS
jgi:triosephosphate isomerase (TIM)